MGAFGMMNLLHKLLLASLAIEWKLAIMHALVQGETSSTRALSPACSSMMGSSMSISSAQLLPGIL